MIAENERIEPLGNGINVIVSKEHNFSSDTIILSDFCAPKSYEKAAELGTGCGALFLFWYALGGPKTVSAVDIQRPACNLASRSVVLNKLDKKVEVICADIKQKIPGVSYGTYDLVACNPPYKLGNSGCVNQDTQKKIARHELCSTVDDFIKAAAGLLRFGGRFCICQRVDRLGDTLNAMQKNRIEPKKIRFVHKDKNSKSKLFLVQGKNKGNPGSLKVLEPLFLECEDGKVSPELKRIYKFFGE